MLKKLFDWTPSDIAQWEKIREKGLRHFVYWYGIQRFSGILFIFFGWDSVFCMGQDSFGKQYREYYLSNIEIVFYHGSLPGERRNQQPAYLGS